MKKTIIVAIDIFLIIATAIPAIWLFCVCMDSAINGVIPWREESELIYGIHAFLYTFGSFCVFELVLVILWALLFFTTFIYTVFTMIYLVVKSKKRIATA